MRRLLALSAIGLLVIVAGGAAADTFALRLVSQTSTTITLGWTPQPGYGYLFSANGQLVSRTNDPNRSTVKFSKANSYEVAVLTKGATGVWPVTQPNPAPSEPGNFRATSVTQTTVNVAWDASTGALPPSNYRVYRDGVVIGQGPGSSGGFADAWQDTGRTCDTSYVYGVDAQNAQGNTSTRATLTVRTSACDVLPPPVGNLVEFTGSVTAAVFLQRINAAPSGPVVARPAAGQSSFTVTGDFTLNRGNVTIQHAVIRDITMREAASGFVVEDSDLHSFDIEGADNWIIRRDNVHFDGVSYTTAGSQFLYDATNWKILDSTFSGFYSQANPSWHTEAWYIGSGNDGGLISGNKFDNNGTTGHLFFTWWGQSGSGPLDPKNICVTNNSFTRSHNAYWHIDMRAELKDSNNIDIDPASNTYDKPFSYTVLSPRWLRAC